MVSPGTAANEPPAEVAAGGIPTVVVVSIVVPAEGRTAEDPTPTVVTGRLSGLPVAVAASTVDVEPTIKVVASGVPAPSDDKLDWGASVPGVLVCCPVLGGVREPKVLAACGFSCELGKAALEGDALVSSCVVGPSWDEVTPFPGCWTMDEWVACDKPSFPVS